jgi:hypothetical protein
VCSGDASAPLCGVRNCAWGEVGGVTAVWAGNWTVDSTTDSAARKGEFDSKRPRAPWSRGWQRLLVGAEIRGCGLELGRCCDTYRLPGAARYLRETKALGRVLVEFTLPGTKALCNTLALSGLKRRLSVAPGAWETGRSTISISSVRGATHAHRAMGPLQVKPEGGEGERDGVQEGGNSCLQGRTQSAPGDLEQKKSSHGRLRRGTGNITQGIRTAGRWTRPCSGAVVSLPASSSSSHGHSRAKLASQLTLLLYHI